MAGKKDASTAVLARRAPDVVEKDDAQTAIYRKLDFFPTAPWGSRAGAEVLLTLDPTCKLVREPACGEMHMAGPLGSYFEVWPSDVYPHTPNTPIRDWLDRDAWPAEPDCDWIITNPPFGIAEDFVRLGLQRARRGVALLLRLAFLETDDRYDLMMGSTPLTQLAVFCERIPMELGRWRPKAGSATAYAWFFWMKDAEPRPIHFLKPGTRKRLWLPGDAEEYGWKPPLPLFEGLTAGGNSEAGCGGPGNTASAQPGPKPLGERGEERPMVCPLDMGETPYSARMKVSL
jgi:hypothetical protein